MFLFSYFRQFSGFYNSLFVMPVLERTLNKYSQPVQSDKYKILVICLYILHHYVWQNTVSVSVGFSSCNNLQPIIKEDELSFSDFCHTWIGRISWKRNIKVCDAKKPTFWRQWILLFLEGIFLFRTKCAISNYSANRAQIPKRMG